MSKIIVTGGHLTPALATIEELRKKEGIEVVFIGRSHATEGDKAPSAESLVIPTLGIKFYGIKPGRLQRRFTRYTLRSLAKAPLGLLQSLGILSRERPQAILSFGSYVALPTVLAGWILGIPIITHEQTLKSGLSNKIIAAFAKKIAVSWEESLQQFPKNKAVMVGNPIRSDLLKIDRRRVSRPTIYITGGNQGAHILNEMVLEILKELLSRYQVIHQTGGSEVNKDFETLVAFSSQLPLRLKNRYKVAKWFDTGETVDIFSRVSLLVGRSGANTVFETMALGIPAVFVPLAIAAGDEQTKNAKLMESLGAAIIVPEERLTPKRLLAAINLISDNYKQYTEAAKKARRSLNLNAAKALAEEVLRLLN